jgi:ubiquitin-conjugating enzyme E2 J2
MAAAGPTPTPTCVKRLTKDYQKYHALVASDAEFDATKATAPFYVAHEEDNLLHCWVVLRGPKGTAFEGGLFLGRIEFPHNFPVAPPKLFMVTPNGRVHLNQRFCTTFSDFHPEEWSPSWSVVTLCKGLVSFLFDESNEYKGMYGAINATAEERRALAAKSHAFNAGNAVYQKLFVGVVRV